MPRNCYGICFTPQSYKSYIEWWNYFNDREDSFLLLDNTQKAHINYKAFQYTEDDIRKNFNFTGSVSRKHYWNSHGNRNIIWFYAHFRMMNFFISHPNYEYYWFFDDDAYCDNWDGFLSGFDDDDSDFLSYFIFKNKNVSEYPNIPMVDDRMYSKEGWFGRFPGDGDRLIEFDNKYFGSFFPIVRYSRRALEKLVEITRSGYHGYGEGFVPTTLARLGFKMNSIFNPDNTSNYFDVNKINVTHKNQKITWEWL